MKSRFPYTNLDIILVEDDIEFKVLLEDSFEEVGLGLDRLHHFEKSNESIDYIISLKKAPYMIFIDINFDNCSMDGWDILKAARMKFGEDTRLIICSTSSSQQEIEKARSLGANAFIVKEVSLEDEQLFTNRIALVRKEQIEEKVNTFKIYSREHGA